MDNLTHSLVGLTLARTRLHRAGPGTTLTLLLASNAPDIDILSLARGDAVDYLLAHRGPTHGPVGVVGLALAASGITRLAVPDARPWAQFAVALIGLLVHVGMDFPTVYYMRIASPFGWRWYGVDWMPIIDVYWWAVLAAGVLAMWRWRRASVPIATAVLLLSAGNYALRASQHARAAAVARTASSPNAVALPTFFNPFRWMLIRPTQGAYDVIEYDVMRRSFGARLRYPADEDRWTRCSRGARSVKALLAFARFPAARVHPQPDGGAIVTWRDLRFLRLPAPPAQAEVIGPFIVFVRLDRHGRIVDDRME